MINFDSVVYESLLMREDNLRSTIAQLQWELERVHYERLQLEEFIEGKGESGGNPRYKIRRVGRRGYHRKSNSPLQSPGIQKPSR